MPRIKLLTIDRNYPFLEIIKTSLVVNIPVALILGFLFCNDCIGDWNRLTVHFAISMLYGTSLFVGMGYWNTWLGRRVDWLNKPWSSFWIAFLSNILLVVIIITIDEFIYLPLFFDYSFAKVWKGLKVMDYFIPVMIGVIVTSIYQGAYFLDTWKKALVQNEEYKRAQLSAQYQSLSAQVNPHFLFNSLNVLSTLVKKDPDKAEQFIQQLSDVYRNVLDASESELIPIQKELKILDSYQFLIETRFGERIHIDNRLQPDADKKIVPLSLQMLLENAVKHNAATLKNPLHIRLSEKDGYWWITNNKIRMHDAAPGKKAGLKNIEERYQLATKRGILVEDEEAEFRVGLPIV